MKLAFLGLGVMGFPMAGHLASKGADVRVYNRTAAKAEAWCAKYGGASAATPARAAEEADIVFACVGGDEDLRAVTLGPKGAFSTMHGDTIFVDHTTTSAAIARELYSTAQGLGFHFLDAPVSGGQVGAEQAKLTVMVGGEQRIFERARPYIESYARAVTHMGPAGSGQLTKMVNQICVVGVMQGLAEGINFGQRAGLDMHRVLEVLGKGAATSWQMENRGGTMIEGKFDFGFAADWMLKDLEICLDEAARSGAALEQTALIKNYFSQLHDAGKGRWDFSALIDRLR
ncbi:MAG TPA: NAD(P)-dependent oxidoreductase [Burkholderiales bacterium]|nr:NAD(P)-dependent oxidoreductase [Burkholderiales bacterium]